jgi:hypothetical protein
VDKENYYEGYSWKLLVKQHYVEICVYLLGLLTIGFADYTLFKKMVEYKQDIVIIFMCAFSIFALTATFLFSVKKWLDGALELQIVTRPKR